MVMPWKGGDVITKTQETVIHEMEGDTALILMAGSLNYTMDFVL